MSELASAVISASVQVRNCFNDCGRRQGGCSPPAYRIAVSWGLLVPLQQVSVPVKPRELQLRVVALGK
jgi:hypothetical protein